MTLRQISLLCGCMVEEIHSALEFTSDADVFGLFEQLERTLTAEDAPNLVTALERQRENFFGVEMFSQVLRCLSDPEMLEPLLVAMDWVWGMGHDGDGFQAALAYLVESKPVRSRAVLQTLHERRPPNISGERNEWLME